MQDRDVAPVTMDDDGAAEVAAERGTMVIRVWNEPGAETPFRGRLTFGRIEEGAPETAVVSSRGQALDMIRTWLESFPD